MPKRDSQSVSTLEDTADRTRQSLPMDTRGPRPLVRTTFGLMAIGRNLTAAISGWRDIGRDGHITTTLVAAIGTATVDMGTGIMTGIGTATTIVDIAGETGSYGGQHTLTPCTNAFYGNPRLVSEYPVTTKRGGRSSDLATVHRSAPLKVDASSRPARRLVHM